MTNQEIVQSIDNINFTGKTNFEEIALKLLEITKFFERTNINEETNKTLRILSTKAWNSCAKVTQKDSLEALTKGNQEYFND